MKKIRFKKISLIYLLLILVFVSAYFLYDAHIQEYRWGKLHSAIEEELKDFRIEASVIIKDLKKERMINIDPDELIPSASLVKIPIMLACFDAARNGGINLTDQIVLEKRHKVDGSGNLKKLQAGEIFSVQTLIELMITESDNTATNMLIELLGFDYLNTKFHIKKC